MVARGKLAPQRSRETVLSAPIMPKSTTNRLLQRRLESRLDGDIDTMNAEDAETMLDAPLTDESNSNILDKVRTLIERKHLLLVVLHC